MKPKIAIIGSGGYGDYIKQALAEQPVDTVVLEAKDKPIDFAGLNDDHIIVATPNFTHFDIVKAALTTGKHVLCEKPLALTVSEVKKLYHIAQVHKSYLGVGFVLTNHPFYAMLKSAQDTLGSIREIRVSNHATEGTLKPEWYWDNAKSGGWFMVAEIHWYHLFAWLTDGKSLNVIDASEKKKDGRTVATTSVVKNNSDQMISIDHRLDMTHDTAWATIEILFYNEKIVLDDWVPRSCTIPSSGLPDRLPNDFLLQNGMVIDQRARDEIYQTLIREKCCSVAFEHPTDNSHPIIIAHEAALAAKNLAINKLLDVEAKKNHIISIHKCMSYLHADFPGRTPTSPTTV